MSFKPIQYGVGFSIDKQLYNDWLAEMQENSERCSRILINARFWKFRFYFRWRARHIQGKRFIIEFNYYDRT